MRLLADCPVEMPLTQIVATGNKGNADNAGNRQLLLDFVSAYPCGLSSIEVEASVYDMECECQESEGWLTAQEEWQFADDLYELEIKNVAEDQWNVAWRNERISNEQLVLDLKRLYYPSPAMVVVWIEGVKAEMAEEAEEHEASFLKQLNGSVRDMIVIDFGD